MNTRHHQSARPAIMRRIGAAMTAIAVALGVSLASAPASKSEPLTGATWVATPNGVAWTPQTVTVKTGNKAGPNVTIAVTGTSGGATTLTAPVNDAGFAYTSWTPTAAGTFTLTASGAYGQLGASSVIVVPAPTLTTLFVPGQVEPGRPVTVFGKVRTLSGSTTPSGTITIRDQRDVIVTRGQLRPTSVSGEALARMEWLPSIGQPFLTGIFEPATNAFATSLSLGGQPLVGGTWSAAIALPPAVYVGVPADVVTVMGPHVPLTVGGSATLKVLVDGRVEFPAGGSTPVDDGAAWSKWNPTLPGNQIVQTLYSSGNFQFGGAPSQWLNVQPAPLPDNITVNPSSASAWTAGSVGSLQQDSDITLTPTSASGNPVIMASDGPCAFEGSVLIMLGPGTCTVTATSFGNGGSLSGTEDTYTINITAAPKKKKRKRG